MPPSRRFRGHCAAKSSAGRLFLVLIPCVYRPRQAWAVDIRAVRLNPWHITRRLLIRMDLTVLDVPNTFTITYSGTNLKMRFAVGSCGQWVYGASLVVGFFSQGIAAECTRQGLLDAAAKYVAAQEKGTVDLSSLPAAATVAYKENNVDKSIKSGILSQALKIEYQRSTADTVACASYTEFVALTPKPYVVGTQIRHNTSDMSVVLIDTIAATTGALRFDASKTLQYFKAESWPALAVEKQPSRELLRQTIDAYLDMWTNSTAIDAIPWGTPCERVEGAAHVSPCTGGAPRGGSKTPNSMRRYVIDEVFGSADVLCSFTAVGNIPDSHEVRIEGGKVRYVHTITLSSQPK